MGKLCSKFGEYWSVNNVTFLSTDAGRTEVYVILYSVQCICITLGRQKMYLGRWCSSCCLSPFQTTPLSVILWSSC